MSVATKTQGPSVATKTQGPSVVRRGTGSRRRLDTLPERSEYRDDGCGGGCERSLECPFPRCRLDDPMGWRREARVIRDRELVRVYAAEGLTVDGLASRFQVSRRTVHRVLSDARKARIRGEARIRKGAGAGAT